MIRQKKSKTLIRQFAIGGALLVALTLCFGRFDPFSFTSVCTRCGALRYSGTYFLPLTGRNVEVHEKHHETGTLISQFLTEKGIVGIHEHNWVFCQGGGHGIRCALGHGRAIRDGVNDRDLLDLFEFVNEKGEAAELKALLGRFFDPVLTRQVQYLARNNASAQALGFKNSIVSVREEWEFIKRHYGPAGSDRNP